MQRAAARSCDLLCAHLSSRSFVISGTPPFTTAYASGSRYFGSSFENNAAVCSEISDGLMTAVLPAVMAPMSGKQQLKNGKFHGLYHIYI